MLLAGVLLAVPIAAQTGAQTGAQTAAPAASAAATGPEPAAMEALSRMGRTLAGLQRFEVRAQTLIDEVTVDGVKLQFAETVALKVQRPDRLRAEFRSDRKERRFVFDGKTLTLFSPKRGYYATLPAPPTIGEMLNVAEQRNGWRLPLADLFTWGAEDGFASGIRDAAVIGPATIDQVLCDHVVVRQDGVDWQVWISRGAQALPRKLVITTTSEATQPQYAAVMTWNLAPRFDAATFAFKPPPGARPIAVNAPADPARPPGR
jgi:hypothetical protein